MRKTGAKQVQRSVLVGVLAFASTLSIAWHPGSPLYLHGTSVLHAGLFFVLCFVYGKAGRLLAKRRLGLCFGGGLALGLCMAAGAALAGNGGFLQLLAVTPGFAFLACTALLFLFDAADRQARRPERDMTHRTKGGRFWGVLPGDGPGAFWKLFLLVAALWLPYYVLCFPGLVTLDTVGQMEMWFGGALFSTHHPPLHTAFIGGCMQLGQALFGSMGAGVALASGVQLLCTAALIALVLRRMAQMGVRRGFCMAAFLFYAVLPLCGLYAVTLWKDIWLANFVLLFVLCVVAIVRKKEAFFKSPKDVGLLALAVLGMIVSKNNGVYIFVLSILVLLAAVKGCRRQLAAVLAAGVVLAAAITGPLYTAMGAARGDAREALSLPMMQLARAVAYDEGRVTDADRDIIDEVLPYDELKDRYQSWIADDVKVVFDTAAFQKDPGRYVGVWLRVGLASPGQYVLATLEHTVGYWYPDVQHWIFAPRTYPAELRQGTTQFAATDPLAGRYAEPLAGALQGLLNILATLRRVPVLSMLYSIGFYFWVLLACGLYAVYKKQREKLLALVPLFVVWLTCLASPVHAEFRYAWPAIICVPVLVGWCFGGTAQPAAKAAKNVDEKPGLQNSPQ